MKRNAANEFRCRALKGCEICTAACPGGFKKVAHLFGPGVAIYSHTQTDLERNDNSAQLRETGHWCFQQNKKNSRSADTFIFHNTSNAELKKNTVISELGKYKTKCITCRRIIKRVRTLLEEIRAIRRNEIYAICDHCKSSGLKCKRCEYILAKFKETQYEEREQHFMQWLCKVKQLLESISKGNICQYRLYQETSDAAEFDNLLMELNSPLIAPRQLEIGAFPSTEFEENLAQSKDMLHELIQKLKSESGKIQYSSDDNLFMPTSGASCVCKYLRNRKLGENKSSGVLKHPDTELPKLFPTYSKALLEGNLKQEDGMKEEEDKEEKDKAKKEEDKKEKNKTKKGTSIKETSAKEKDKARKGSSTKESTSEKENKSKLANKTIKSPHSEASNLFKKLLADRQKVKPKPEKPQKDVVPRKLPTFGVLPELRTLKKVEVVEEVSESVLECDEKLIEDPKEMIKGKTIVPYHEHRAQESDPVQPLLFKVAPDCPVESLVKTPQTTSTARKKNEKSQSENRSGIIQYKLSDRQFIDNGWTQLPSTKIMRRMNVYKMIPARPYDWFDLHKDRKDMSYASGEKLSEIDKDGQGKWFYKSGRLALEYYNAEEVLAQKRCVVYGYESCGKVAQNQRVLACFDYLGNGVVYDFRGNERLKYNQTEGHLIDEKIGPPGFWKWHTLNEPPVLQKRFIDTYSKDRLALDKIIQQHEHETPRGHRDVNAAMLAIELDNFVKEKADKLLQKFKPFQIRTKTVKINDYFSLRVIDQSNIYLLFRDGAITLKLNLGMLLQNKEIIDTESAELSSVATPYDRAPARSRSVSKLQDLLLAARGTE